MSVIRLVGCLLILLCVIYIRKEYSAYISRRMSEMKGFSDLLSHMEGEISKYLSYGRDMWQRFSCDPLERVGLLALLRDGQSASDAISLCSDRLSISAESRDSLLEFFRGFGGEYREETLRGLGEYHREFDKRLYDEETELQKNLKVTSALLLGGALALLILVI